MSEARGGRGKSRRLLPILISLTLCFAATAPAFAKDLDVLIRITYAAFLSEQGASMCNLPRLPLSDEDRTVFVAAKSYANWIKQQISTGLSDQDVRYVLMSAATRARNELRQVIEVLKSNPPDVETAELYRWCTGPMKGIVQKVLGEYTRQPGAIEQIIKEAKE